MRDRGKSWIVNLAVAALLVLTSGAAAAQYVGAAHQAGGPSTLYAIDGGGVATPIGAIGFAQVGGIDFDPLTGQLYGIGRRFADGERVCLLLDLLGRQVKTYLPGEAVAPA